MNRACIAGLLVLCFAGSGFCAPVIGKRGAKDSGQVGAAVTARAENNTFWVIFDVVKIFKGYKLTGGTWKSFFLDGGEKVVKAAAVHFALETYDRYKDRGQDDDKPSTAGTPNGDVSVGHNSTVNGNIDTVNGSVDLGNNVVVNGHINTAAVRSEE